MQHDRPRIVVAVTGASGAIYAIRLIKAGLEFGAHLDVVVSDYGKRLLLEECDWNVKNESIETWLDRRHGQADRPGHVVVHNVHDLGASIASGSQTWQGMVVLPCSMKTLSGIAHGRSSTLIERAADVTLKERRPLVLVQRETPLNLIHLENMTRAARAGAAIVPAMPAFYHGPETFDDLADFVADRALRLVGIEAALVPAWKG